ncbi:oxygen-dependent protoporphyrinogen oxidase, partial [Tulasnella sp. 418]
DGRTALEAGPRTLRGTSPALLELIEQLGLRDALVTTSKSSPAAQSRFLYLPPLTMLPNNLLSALLSPEMRPLSIAAMKEFFKGGNRPAGIMDESVDSFISRRFSPEIARKFLSPMIHGIYAADSRQLSIKSTLKILWRAEELGRGSFIRGLPSALQERAKEHRSKLLDRKYQASNLPKLMKNVSTFSFRGGLSTLSLSLASALGVAQNVDLRVDVGCVGIEPGQEIKLHLSDGTTLTASHVVSTLPFPVLDSIVTSSKNIPSHSRLPHLNANPASTVQVLNLLLPPTPAPLHPPGFGYLISKLIFLVASSTPH